jgi:hypothetical protein
MSSLTAQNQLAFQRPLLSYVDAHQAEPELGTPVQPRKSRGLGTGVRSRERNRCSWSSHSPTLRQSSRSTTYGSPCRLRYDPPWKGRS